MSSKQEGGEEPKKEQLDNEVVTNQKGGRQDTASSGAKGEKVEHSDSAVVKDPLLEQENALRLLHGQQKARREQLIVLKLALEKEQIETEATLKEMELKIPAIRDTLKRQQKIEERIEEREKEIKLMVLEMKRSDKTFEALVNSAAEYFETWPALLEGAGIKPGVKLDESSEQDKTPFCEAKLEK